MTKTELWEAYSTRNPSFAADGQVTLSSAGLRKRRESFKARHAGNIAKGKLGAAYWADKVKW